MRSAGGPAEPTDLIRSVSRALRIIEEVSRSPRPLPVKVIAHRCQLHLSTAYHLVRTLCYEGYLVRLPGGGYVAGSGLAERFHELMSTLRRPPRPGRPAAPGSQHRPHCLPRLHLRRAAGDRGPGRRRPVALAGGPAAGP